MGYFANASEAMTYMDAYCDNCVHDENCKVIDAHLLFQGHGPDGDAVLNMLIPYENGRNFKCSMFRKVEDE